MLPTLQVGVLAADLVCMLLATSSSTALPELSHQVVRADQSPDGQIYVHADLGDALCAKFTIEEAESVARHLVAAITQARSMKRARGDEQ